MISKNLVIPDFYSNEFVFDDCKLCLPDVDDKLAYDNGSLIDYDVKLPKFKPI